MSSFFKKLLFVVGGGFAFGGAAALGGLVGIDLYYQYQKEEMLSSMIAEDTESVGMPCEKFYAVSVDFIKESVTPLIEAGRAGKDWVALASPQLLEQIKDFRDKASSCESAQITAKYQGTTIEGNFEGLYRLFSSLSTFLTSWSGSPASASELKPEAFRTVETSFQEIVSPSPKSGSTDPAVKELKPSYSMEPAVVEEVIEVDDDGFEQIAYIVNWKGNRVAAEEGPFKLKANVGERVNLRVSRMPLDDDTRLLRFTLWE